MNVNVPDEKAIFNIAVNIACVDARCQYLEQSCVDHPDMKSRIEVMLRMQEEEPEFLEVSADACLTTGLDLCANDQPGDRIGPYKLLEVIGEGGMGTVYMAEQTEPVHRRVALKLIKAGMDTQQVVARFEAERQALALMDHSNIARVLDAGSTESGHPYFVMELVKGRPITQFCDQQQLDTQSRLKLFQQVCLAVQHAHQKGIIHRDIKPSNVLVAMYDDTPVPKVIDFGVAKATGEKLTEKTMFTRFGQIVGSLEYMSPEQAQFNQLDIDTRSDIYSLGGILHELLTGQPPFERDKIKNQALDETLRMIREDEPTKPSTKLSGIASAAQIASNRKTSVEKLSSILRGDLDWIVMKALEKDRSRRYETANGLAFDIERYLNDEPVSATPPSTAYRFRKFASRNKVGLAFASIIGLFLIAGTVGLAISNFLLAEREQATRVALRKADKNYQLAQDNLQLARASEEQARLDAAIAESVNNFVNTDLLGKADPHEEPNRDLTVSEVLDRAILSIEGQFVDQPLVEADVRKTIAKSLLNLGRYDEAESQAIAIRDIFLSGLDPTDRRILDVESFLAWILHERGRYKQSLEKMEPLLGLCKQNLGLEDSLTLHIASDVADLRRHLGQYAVAEQQLLEIIAIQERVFGTDDDHTLGTKTLLARTLGTQGKYAEAELLFREAYDILARKLGAEHPRTLSAKSGLAESIALRGPYAEAEQLYRDVYETSRRVLGSAHNTTIDHLTTLAAVLREDGQYDSAEALLRDAIEELALKVGNEHPLIFQIKKVLATVLIRMGKFAEAEQIYRKLLDTGYDSKSTLASLYRKQLRLAEAEELYRDEYESRKQRLGSEHPLTLNSLGMLAHVIRDLGRYEDAEKLFQEVVETQAQIIGAENPFTLDSLTGLAKTLLHQGRDLEATRIYQQVLDVQKQQLRPDHPSTLTTKNELAVVFWRNDQLDKSIPLFEELARAHEAELGEDHPQTLAIVGNLGVNQKDAGRIDDAIRNLERCHEATSRHPNLLDFTASLIDAYVKKGETDQAAALVPEYLTRVRTKLPKNMVATHLAMLARELYLPTEQFDKAEEVLRECLSIFNQERPDRWDKHIIEFRLGIALLAQNKIDEAEKRLSQGFEGMTLHRDSFSQRGMNNVIRSIGQVSSFYDILHVENASEGYDEEAAEWRAKLKKFQARDKPKELK